MESLSSVLGVTEDTAKDFTAQSVSDIANRAVEFFQILERLARNGDTICRVLEAQTSAQQEVTKVLRLILPHIKTYFAEQAAQKQALEGKSIPELTSYLTCKASLPISP